MEVALERVTVRYGARAALTDFSLVVPPGTHLVLFGSAGSGKTTALKALAGLQRVDEGTVRWDGHPLPSLAKTQRDQLQRRLGMVFQSDALFDSLTVRQNVAYPLQNRGVGPEQADELVRATLERVGLWAAADRHPEALSGGMKKRLGIARALVSRPEVLLADDPFAGLDPKTEAAIAALLIEVAQDRTLIVALSDDAPSLKIDRRVELVEGRRRDARSTTAT